MESSLRNIASQIKAKATGIGAFRTSALKGGVMIPGTSKLF